MPAPAIDLSWEAVSSAQSGCGCLPPDTNGDVSDQHYIQWVNTRWAVYDKTDGSVVQGPTNGNSFFVGFGGKCETTNPGDPIALWDPRAQRWVMSQFVTSAPFAQCVAVSTTSDPLGTYNRYEFDWTELRRLSEAGRVDRRFGSQDAYLLTTHEFQGQSFQGAAFIALERDKMLTGDPTAAMVRFGGNDAYGVEPINLVGTLNAPANACGGYVHFDCEHQRLPFLGHLPRLGHAGEHARSRPTRPASPARRSCRTSTKCRSRASANGLDPFGTHIMYRANARAFPADAPTRISLVVNHVVQGDVQQGGINWMHFNLDDHGADVHDADAARQDARSRKAPTRPTATTAGWAASRSTAAATSASASRSRARPSIRRSRSPAARPKIRRARCEDEQNCTDGIGNGSQTSTSNRWGDYSSMSVDPVDQCTFYFTNEYYPTTRGASVAHARVQLQVRRAAASRTTRWSPNRRGASRCAARRPSTDPSYSMRVGVLNGFTGPVNLVANGVPAGATADFSVNPINAPGSSMLTLTGGAALPSGEYAMTVDGTSGASTRTLSLSLGVSANAPAATQLVSPPDAAPKSRCVRRWSGARRRRRRDLRRRFRRRSAHRADRRIDRCAELHGRSRDRFRVHQHRRERDRADDAVDGRRDARLRRRRTTGA